MRLILLSLPVVSLVACVAQGARSLAVYAPPPSQPAPSSEAVDALRAEVRAFHARQAAQRDQEAKPRAIASLSSLGSPQELPCRVRSCRSR